MQTKPTIRIVAADIYRKDAIGNFCFDLSALYKKTDYPVSLYAKNFTQTEKINAYQKIFSEYNSDDLIFYHYSIYDENFKKIAQLPCKKIIYFHGITPPSLLEKYETETAILCKKGIEELKYIDQFDLICVNSWTTKNQIETQIKKNIHAVILPPIIISRDFIQNLQSKISVQKSKKTILTVGRIAPHKKIEDVIELLYQYTVSHPDVVICLNIVGVCLNKEYQAVLDNLVEKYHLSNQVKFLGKVSDEVLSKTYNEADCYICLSEHEGFGLTLLEAMKSEIPILAYMKSGIQEVLGESGIHLKEKDYPIAVKLLHQVLFDKNYQDIILTKQKKQLISLQEACREKRYQDLILIK